MSLIDWSDPEEMFGLLVETVGESDAGDAESAGFLDALYEDLDAIAKEELASANRLRIALQQVLDAQPREFASDPVLEHVRACIDELQRIEKAETV